MRIITANVNGIRSAANKGFFEWLQTTNADVICLQEVKAQAADMTAEMLSALPNGMPASRGYHGHFHYAEKKGYSGVAIYSKLKPDAVIEGLGMTDIDSEGRYIECQFRNLSVVSLYLPSGSSGEERQNFKFSVLARIMPHLEALAKSGREVVICGDWNIAHQEIDLKNYKSNKKNSGFLPEERAWFSDLFGRVGWVDVYRNLHPNTTDDCYTWWSNRGAAYEKNVGWRLDYQVATPNFAQKASGCSIYKTQKFSDHAPLIIDYLSA
jgi:exodeoxyribonuclease III